MGKKKSGQSQLILPSHPPVPIIDEDYSFIRVTFNRKLTWSERETLRTRLHQHDEYIQHEFDLKNSAILLLETAMDSREASELVSVVVAYEFLNVHPRAVRTIDPVVTV